MIPSKLALVRRRIHGVGKHICVYRNFPFTIAVNLGAGPKTGEHELHLRNGLRFTMDAPYLVPTSNAVKDVVADDVYGLDRLQGQHPEIIIDIGAHVGAFCLYAAKQCPTATIHAYEPSPRSYSYLCRNIAANNLTERVIPHQQAVAGENGQLSMFSSRRSATRHSLYEDDFLDTQDGEKVTVEGITLAVMFSQLRIASCDFLKMDCEGAEYEILFTAPNEVLQKVQRVGMEYHERLTEWVGEDLVRFFTEHGFGIRHTPVFEDAQLGMLLAEREEE